MNLVNSCFRFSSVVVFFALNAGCIFNCKTYLDNEIKPLSLHGIVVSKEKTEYGCFGNILLQDSKGIDTLKDMCYCVPENQGLWDYVVPGDSLAKSGGSLEVAVFRNSASRLFTYPCCSQ